MNELFEPILKAKIVPVIKLTDTDQVRGLGEALTKSGLPLAEITLRSPVALACIKAMKDEFPQMLIGAGTVTTTDQADAAMAAGAKFIVTPGFNPTVVDHCITKGYPIIPGVTSPSLVEWAMERGLTRLKFFPAEAAGGANYLKNLAPVYPEASFMPTGGVNKHNIKDYLALPNVYACGGSWIVKTALLEAHDFAEVERLTVEVLKSIGGAL